MSNIKILNRKEGQFQYKGRWVNKEHFRAFVYNSNGDQKLAGSYKEFHDLISSGIWFAERQQTPHKRKPRDGTLRANS